MIVLKLREQLIFTVGCNNLNSSKNVLLKTSKYKTYFK